MQLAMKLSSKSACALALLLCAGGACAQMFKWTDSKGVVHYSDEPPREDARVERKSFAGGMKGVQLPYALAEAARKSPVVLYTSSACVPCDQGRALLQQRGIPFAEKTVTSNADQQALVEAGGADQLPVLLVGDAKRLGFQASAWNAALSDAAYPTRRILPANYKNPAAEPAAPTPHPLARDIAPDPLPTPAPASPPRPPAAAPETPAGFRF
jgi:glutaredoxin